MHYRHAARYHLFISLRCSTTLIGKHGVHLKQLGGDILHVRVMTLGLVVQIEIKPTKLFEI